MFYHLVSVSVKHLLLVLVSICESKRLWAIVCKAKDGCKDIDFIGLIVCHIHTFIQTYIHIVTMSFCTINV